MTWLVTGGAGYIGSHVVRALGEAGLPVVVIDDLSTGLEQFVPESVPFVRGTLLDGALVEQTLREHAVTGVIHIAGFKYAGVSVQRPLHTYEQNVSAMVTLLKAMETAGVDRVVFSSSAATYGTPDGQQVDETTPTRPESPYGETKLIGEWLLRDAGRASGLRHTSLRYFNVVGSGSTELFDVSPTTCSRWCSTCCTAVRPRASTAPTTPPRTARVCATTSTSAMSRWRTSPRPVASTGVSRWSRCTTSAAVRARRCARS